MDKPLLSAALQRIAGVDFLKSRAEGNLRPEFMPIMRRW